MHSPTVPIAVQIKMRTRRPCGSLCYLFAVILCSVAASSSLLPSLLGAQAVQNWEDPCLNSGPGRLEPGEEAWIRVRAILRDPGVKVSEVCEQLVKKAKNEALRCALGEHITTSSSLVSKEMNNEIMSTFQKIIRQEVSGSVVAVRNISYKGYFQDIYPVFICELEAKVRRDEEQRDADFEIYVSLNKPDRLYKPGEELTLMVRPTKDCYLTVFNVCSDESVRMLYPNERMPQELIRSGNLVEIPSAEQRKSGIHLHPRVRPGRSQEMEELLVVATKEPREFVSVEKSADRKDVIPTYKAAAEEIQRWILGIEHYNRTSADVPYTITSN